MLEGGSRWPRGWGVASVLVVVSLNSRAASSTSEVSGLRTIQELTFKLENEIGVQQPPHVAGLE